MLRVHPILLGVFLPFPGFMLLPSEGGCCNSACILLGGYCEALQ